jgi:hypothetical protein
MDNEVTILATLAPDGAVAECHTTITIDDVALEAFWVATERRPCPCEWGHYCTFMESALNQFLPWE